jgi:cardiolipin synthase
MMKQRSAIPVTGWGLRDLPNAITVLRILAVVPLVWLLIGDRYPAALWLAFFAGLSDAVDGYLAKRFGWVSRVGGILDPLADKFLLVSCVVVLAMKGHLPMWLLWLVLGRDLLIVGGAAAFNFLVQRVEHAAPSRLSKLNTCMQIALVLLVLVELAYGWELRLVTTLVMVTALTTITSGVHYVWYWGRKAREKTSDEVH